VLEMLLLALVLHYYHDSCHDKTDSDDSHYAKMFIKESNSKNYCRQRLKRTQD
jgi:SOS response regulatory protein OraA/RecX